MRRDDLKIKAKNGLENCCVAARNTHKEEKLDVKFEAGDEEKCAKDALDQVNKNPSAERVEVEAGHTEEIISVRMAMWRHVPRNKPMDEAMAIPVDVQTSALKISGSTQQLHSKQQQSARQAVQERGEKEKGRKKVRRGGREKEGKERWSLRSPRKGK